MKAALILMAAALLMVVVRLDIHDKRIVACTYILVFILNPCVSYFLGLLILNIGTSDTTAWKILLNIDIVMFLQLAALLLGSNLRFSFIVGSVVPFVLTLVNAYVYTFRGNAMTPADLLSIQTAANVAVEYDFTPSPTMLYAILLEAIVLLAFFCIPYLRFPRTKHNILGTVDACAFCLFFLLLGSRDIVPKYWQENGALQNGYILNFTLQIKDIFIVQPEGYSENLVNELAMQYTAPEAEGTTPDIIVIMDESFADFRVFDSDMTEGMDNMPYVDALSENTIRGYLCASVFGGSTANSEYEFLFGNTMAFLPQGSIVYQQYFSENSQSLLSVLKKHGYACIAMHPYYANGWMRDSVYPRIGFDEMYFLEDFPQKQMLRKYVSDQEMFEQIVQLHRAHDADTPLFLFGVTMQNHGGYAYNGADFESTVSLDGCSEKYPEVEQYLTLIQETDKAVEYLSEYYKTSNRDVVIVFFGDHMPNVEQTFYDQLNGGSISTLDAQMRKQMVPFFIWANFDIEERTIPCSSINYLSLYTLEAANIPLPAYYQFLKDTEAVIPAINALGYYSEAEQGFLPLESASGEEAEALQNYEVLQYNNMFDEKNRNVFFFGK